MGFWKFDKRIITPGTKPWGYANGQKLGGLTPYSLSFSNITDKVSLSGLENFSWGAEASISFWVKLRNAIPPGAAYTALMNIGSGDKTTRYPWYINGDGYFCAFRSSRVDSVTLESSVNRENWHLITITTTSGTDGWKFYQNDILVRTEDGESSVNISGTPYLGSWGLTDEILDGWIDSARLFNRVLSTSEISNIINNPYDAIGDEVAFYPMNEGTGTTLVDHSGNGYDGTINGATWVAL